jgi:hypothetical protein
MYGTILIIAYIARWPMKASGSTLLLVLLLSSASGQEKPDFSGRYLLNPPKLSKHEKAPPPSSLRVTQNERSLEATITEGGHTRTTRYLLDGSPSENLTEGGIPSRDTARLKGKALTIESTVTRNATVLHMKQKWQLSRDSQTLTIHSSVQGTSLGITTDLFSTDEIYTRQP